MFSNIHSTRTVLNEIQSSSFINTKITDATNNTGCICYFVNVKSVVDFLKVILYNIICIFMYNDINVKIYVFLNRKRK